MKKILVIISIIIILIGAYLGYRGFSRPSGEFLYNFETVNRGQIIQKVSVTGSVISDTDIDLQMEVGGQIIDMPVSMGQLILKDNILAKLSDAEYQARVSSAAAAVAIAQAQLSKTYEGTRPEEITVYESLLQKAKDDLEKSEIDLKKEQQDLLDAEAKATEDLNQAYEVGLDSARSVYTIADNTLTVIKDIRESYFTGNSQLTFSVKLAEDTAKNSLSNAQSNLNTAVSTNNFSDIDLALSALKQAVLVIRNSLATIRNALDDPTISPTSADKTLIDTERTTTETAIGALTAAQQTISLTKVNNATNINAAELAIEQAAKNLDTAKTNLQKSQNDLALKKAGPTQADIALAQAQVAQANANLLEAQKNLQKTVLRAPINGIVTKINFEVGEKITPNDIIISIINDGGYQIAANISETDIAKIKLNDRLEITLDALGPEEVFIGRLIEIEPAETVISGVIYYKVKSIFETDDPRVRSGMTVNLDIITEQKENALYLPFYAIKQKNGTKYVEFLENGKVVEKSIITGIEGETNIEILEGLTEGQKVITGQK